MIMETSHGCRKGKFLFGLTVLAFVGIMTPFFRHSRRRQRYPRPLAEDSPTSLRKCNPPW